MSVTEFSPKSETVKKNSKISEQKTNLRIMDFRKLYSIILLISSQSQYVVISNDKT